MRTWIETTMPPRVRDAVWQYMIDHSRIEPDGYMTIILGFRDEDDMWRRIEGRYDGFKRYSVLKKKEACRKVWEEYVSLQRQHNRRCQRHQEIDRTGSTKEKILLWVHRKITKKLFHGIRNNKTRQER